jgi:hypothetical protein
MPLHQEFWKTGNRVRDPACFIVGQMLARQRPTLQTFPEVDYSECDAIGIPHDVFVLGFFDRPRGRKSTGFGT